MALRTRRRALSVGVVAVALLTAACGSSGPGSESETEGSASAWALTGGDEQSFRTSFEDWSVTNPDSAIGVEFFANDAYKQKVRTALGAGDAPTLLYSWGGGTLAEWVETGKVLDLTDAIAEDPDLTGKFLPAVLGTGEVDGKTYAVPNNAMQPVILYYNKELFDSVGAKPPTTWDELMALVPVFNEAGIAPFSVGGQSRWPLLMWEEYLVDRIGGPEVFDAIAANEPGAWSDPAVIKANQLIQELVKADGFVDGFASIAADSGADSALLYTGKAAMYLMGTWAYPSIKTADPDFIAAGNLGYIPFPAVAGGVGDPANIAGNPANFWSINADATEAEQAAVTKYLSEGLMNDAYVDALLAGGAVPPVAGLESKLAALDDAEYLTTVYGLATEAPHFQLSWDQAIDPSQADTMLNNLSQLFLLEITPEEFSTAMDGTLK